MTCTGNCGGACKHDGDAIACLFDLLRRCDAKPTLYGMPVTEDELREHVARKARERLREAATCKG